MTSTGISSSWWYRPTYAEHPLIRLAVEFGNSFEVALKALQEHDDKPKCLCRWCGLPLSLCMQKIIGPDGDDWVKCCANYPDHVSWAKYEAEGWIKAQEESNPVEAVLSEKIVWD